MIQIKHVVRHWGVIRRAAARAAIEPKLARCDFAALLRRRAAPAAWQSWRARDRHAFKIDLAEGRLMVGLILIATLNLWIFG